MRKSKLMVSITSPMLASILFLVLVSLVNCEQPQACSREANQNYSIICQLDDDNMEKLRYLRDGRSGSEPNPRFRNIKEYLKPLYSQENFDAITTSFFERHKWHGSYNISQLLRMALVTKFHSSTYSDLLIHKYDDFNEMLQSNGVPVDNEKCIKYLEELIPKMKDYLTHTLRTRDVNLGELVDSWGRPSSGLFLGDLYWPGLFYLCKSAKISTSDGQVEARPCVLALRERGNSPDSFAEDDLLGFKMGVCIPRLCDSSNYRNKFQLLGQLAEISMSPLFKDQSEPRELYCFPDDESPSRQWYKRPASLATVALIGGWLILIAYATFKWEQYRRYRQAKQLPDRQQGQQDVELEVKTVQRRFSAPEQQTLSMTNGPTVSSLSGRQPSRLAEAETPWSFNKIFRCLAVTHNFKCLFDTSKSSALMETGSRLDVKLVQAKSSKLDTESQRQLTKKLANIVDLRVVEGIKVISLSYVIMGHVLMCLSMSVKNGRDVGSFVWSPSFFVANLVPAFAVNSFFSITGVLTAYLLLKQNKSFTFVTSPGRWLAFIIYRYLRIMPMYALVVVYGKYLAKYASHGPFWDYGTSILGQRRQCELESWWWVLLFGANFKPPLEHCIPSAWYLANDFQFSLVTPIFLLALFKNPRLGRRLLVGGIIAGYLANFFSILWADVVDLRPVARFMPHGFKTYITSLSAQYTQPQFRIPAYLCGLLIGHSLFEYEESKRRQIIRQLDNDVPETKTTCPGENNCDAKGETTPFPAEAIQTGPPQHKFGWSSFFQNYGLHLSGIFVLICIATPVIGAALPFNKRTAKFMVALVMPTYHVMFALAVGFYIILATSGFGIKPLTNFLTLPFWKPISRLSLCAMLFNIEIINYLLQSMQFPVFFSNFYLVSLMLTSIFATFVVATLICVLFEAPIRSLLNLLLSMALERSSTSKQKSD